MSEPAPTLTFLAPLNSVYQQDKERQEEEGQALLSSWHLHLAPCPLPATGSAATPPHRQAASLHRWGGLGACLRTMHAAAGCSGRRIGPDAARPGAHGAWWQRW